VSRYPNPYRRRGGWRRGEPMPLFVLPPHDPFGAFLAVLGTLGRAGWRYRSELAPVAVGAVTWWAGWRLHATHPAAWPVLAVLAAVLAAAVVWAPRRWPRLRRLRILGQATGRLVLALWLAVGGGWLAAAAAAGPTRPPLGALWLWATIGCGLPWWANRWRRARVRIARTVERWPELTDTVAGLAGSTVRSAVVDVWGWTARVLLRRGQTVRAVVDQMASIESALATRPGAVRIEPDPTDARAFLLRVITSDPHAKPIGWPGLVAPDPAASITRPVVVGVFEDGTPVAVPLLRRHVLIGGTTGAGKSALLAVLLAILTGCPDVTVWGADLKQGMELAAWQRCLHRLATTPDQAAALLADAVAELDRRAELLATLGGRVWQPTAQAPALVIVVDEYAELPDTARQSADSIARRGRAVAVTLLVATQRPTQAAMGHGAVRSQMDVRVCLRVRERRDADLILGQGAHTAGWHPENLIRPGTFLISAPEHSHPRPARGYLLTDADVAAVARRNVSHRLPGADAAPQATQKAAEPAAAGTTGRGRARSRATGAAPGTGDSASPDALLWDALRSAHPAQGVSVAELVTLTGMSRATVYRRLQALAAAGRAEQTPHGRWRAATAGPM
jgi:DNA segregation ATPase FtsK/SpoIIIE, S-DNA-T family